MTDVTIIGGGWSVRDIDLAKLPGTVIAVNDSARRAPLWHVAVSMDRLWAENRIDFLREHNAARDCPKEVWLRRSAVQNLPEVAALPWVKVFDNDNTDTKFSPDESRLNGTNSGACALNLAWRMWPRRVFLLGFDMNRDEAGRAYWYPPYPWTTSGGSTSARKYATWADQFQNAAACFAATGCQVFNVSPRSAINVWPKITPKRFLGMFS